MKKENRGRPAENDTPIIEYKQTFTNHEGEKIEWNWDKSKSRGPLSVTFFHPMYRNWERIEKELEALNKKYTQKPGERKLRLTKEDKLKYQTLEKELLQEQYTFFPEDRPGFKKVKKEKVAKVVNPNSTGKRGRPKKVNG